MSRLFRPKGYANRPVRHPVRTGVILLLLISIGFAAAFNKHRISTSLSSGQTVSAEFGRQYLLKPYLTPVKIAGVAVGTVTKVTRSDTGAKVEMKVFGSNAGKLGTDPTAAIRLTTLLGGNPYVQLTPGGQVGSPSGTIPLSRSTTPVYFDNVMSSITPPAQEGIRKFVSQTDLALNTGGAQSAAAFFAQAPGALVPTGEVLQALQGEQPGDLTKLIASASQTDTIITRQMGQIESVVTGFGTFSATLGQESQALATTINHLPVNEARTTAGFASLDGTLNELNITSAVARPSVQALTRLLVQSQPTLVDSPPILARLNPFLADTTPLFQQLVPTAQSTTKILSDINGPTLAHLIGPDTTSANGRTIQAFLPQLTSLQHVELQRPATLYQEMGYTFSGLDSNTSFYDGTGHQSAVLLGQGPQGNFTPGAHVGSNGNAYQQGTGCGAETCPVDNGVTP